MGKVLLEEQSLIDIANSIRNKTKSTETMKPSEMASNIDGIETGGGDLSEYFDETITYGSSNTPGFANALKKIPALKNTGKDNSYMFTNYKGTNLDLSNFDTSQVTDIEYMFSNCYKLTSLDLSSFDTSNVTIMRSIFNSCSNLTSIDLSNFNTGNVTNMGTMFQSCSKLTSLDLSNFNTNNVTNMSGMFNGCNALTSLNISSWNTSNVTNMSNMFSYCISIEKLDLKNWVTPNLTTTNTMFNSCKKLKYLDIRNFEFTKVTSYSNMFGSNASFGVPDDCLIIVKDDTAKTWITSKFSRLTNVKTVAEYESGV